MADIQDEEDPLKMMKRKMMTTMMDTTKMTRTEPEPSQAVAVLSLPTASADGTRNKDGRLLRWREPAAVVVVVFVFTVGIVRIGA